MSEMLKFYNVSLGKESVLKSMNSVLCSKIKINVLYLHRNICCSSLPNDKRLDPSKLKAFADEKIDVTKKIGKSRKHCRKRLPAFSPFPTMFSKPFLLRVVKSRDCVVKR